MPGRIVNFSSFQKLTFEEQRGIWLTARNDQKKIARAAAWRFATRDTTKAALIGYIAASFTVIGGVIIGAALIYEAIQTYRNYRKLYQNARNLAFTAWQVEPLGASFNNAVLPQIDPIALRDMLIRVSERTEVIYGDDAEHVISSIHKLPLATYGWPLDQHLSSQHVLAPNPETEPAPSWRDDPPSYRQALNHPDAPPPYVLVGDPPEY